MKYREMFNDVQFFTDGTHVIGGWYSRVDAAKRISNDIGDHVDPESLTKVLVRFGFTGSDVEGFEDFDGPVWHTGATGKGSKPVWIFNKQRINEHDKTRLHI